MPGDFFPVNIDLDRMTGVYYQADHQAGEFLHFVFACAMPPDASIRPDPHEVAEHGFFAADELPEPISASTRLRVLDGLKASPLPLPVSLPSRAEP